MANKVYIEIEDKNAEECDYLFKSTTRFSVFLIIKRFTGNTRKFVLSNYKERACMFSEHYLLSMEDAEKCKQLMEQEEQNRIFTHHRVIKAWHYTCDYEDVMNDVAVPEKGCVLVCRQGFARGEDYYLCVPETGFYTRSANCGRYGNFMREYFVDGEFCGAGSMSKEDNARKLYEAGYGDEVASYINGYTLWRETTLGGKHINERKAAARLSHFYCEEGGRAGHDMRQQIRRKILNGTFNY